MNGWEAPVAERPAFAALRAGAAQLEGWIDDDVGPQLYRLAHDVAPGDDVIEVGPAPSKSALWLAGAVRDRGRGRCVAIGDWRSSAGETGEPRALRDLRSAAGAAGVGTALQTRRAASIDAGLGWDGGIGVGLLHVLAQGDLATLRRTFECWARFVMVDGLVVIDGVTHALAPSRLAVELPRWFRWYSNCMGKCVVIKVDEPFPVRR